GSSRRSAGWRTESGGTGSTRGSVNDAPQEWRRDGVVVTTDRAKIDLDQVLRLLRSTWWGTKMTPESTALAVSESLTFAVLDSDRVIGDSDTASAVDSGVIFVPHQVERSRRST